MPHRRLAIWLAALALLSFNFALNLQQNGKAFLQVDAYSHYQAKRPYQYRLLMAPVMAASMHVLSEPAPKALLAKLPEYVGTPEGATYVLINAIAFFASCWLMAAIARKVLATDRAVRLVLAAYIGMAYLFVCLNPNLPFILPYDIPALALSQACLLAMLNARWVWVYPLFALATLNRETAFLVVVWLGVQTLLARPSARRAFGHVVALSALWLLIKLGLYLRFADLPSDEGLRIAYNLRSLLKPWQWPALLPLVASFAISLMSLRANRRQREWAITGCIGFALIFCVGQITETRAFADLMTFFALAIAQWLLLPVASGSASRLARR